MAALLKAREEKLRLTKEIRKKKALENKHENKYHPISVQKKKNCLQKPAIFPILAEPIQMPLLPVTFTRHSVTNKEFSCRNGRKTFRKR